MKIQIAAVVGLVLVSTACRKEEASVPEPEVKVVEVGSSESITVPKPEQYPLVQVTEQSAANELKVNGVVAPDVNRTVPVNTLLSGRVTAIRVRLGDTVKKGQVLLNVVSPDLEMAFSDYQKFQADLELAQKQYERSKLLFDHGALAAKDLEVAESVLNKARVDVKTTAERLRIQGADPDHMSSVFEVKAPVSGTITAQNTAASASIKTPDNAPDLFTISDLSHVWVLCDVYENLMAEVHLGDTATVHLNAYDNVALKGRVSNIGQVLDPATRTAKVRLELDNGRGLMKPGMFALVTFYSQKKVARQVVPATAVFRLHDKSWVFVPGNAKGNFKRMEVQLGATTADGSQEILSGLQPGDRVVKNALSLSSTGDQS